MAITQRTATVAESNSSASITGTLPSDRQDGDLVVVVVAMTCAAASVTGPTGTGAYGSGTYGSGVYVGGGGWTELVAPTQATTTLTVAAYYAFDSDAEPVPAPTVSTSGSAAQMTALCQAFGGVDTGTPVDVAAVTSSTAGATTLACTGVTTTTANALVLSGVAAGTTSRTLTISGLTEIAQYSHSSTGRAGGLAGAVQASAGATGSKTWGNTAAVSLAYVGFVTALRAATSTAHTGSATSTVTATGTADGDVWPIKGSATSTVTASATAAGSAGLHGSATSAVTAAGSTAGAVASPVFPMSPLPVTVLMLLGGTWTDVTGWVYGRDRTPVTITRGRSSETATVERQTLQLQLDNRDGRWSPRNPAGPHYGQLTRNTPIGVVVDEGAPYLYLPGTAGSCVSTPDSPALSVTGDLDLRVDLRSADWAGAAGFVDLVGKWDQSAADQRSYRMVLQRDATGCYPWLSWSTDGTSAGATQVPADAYLPTGHVGRIALRATLDVDNGAGGWTVRFYWAATTDGPWRQLGTARTGTGATSVHDGTAALTVGDAASTTYGPLPGYYYSAEVRSGIGGTLVANPVFTGETGGGGGPVPTTWFDDQGNAWSVAGDAALTRSHVRFIGEVSEWPQKWDTTGRNAWVPLTASGVLRRLGQGASPVQSVLRRSIPALPALVAYWPVEDGADSLSVAAGIDGCQPMTVTYSQTWTDLPKFASNSDFKASAPLPVVNTARLDATAPPHTATGQAQVRFLLSVPTAGLTDLTVLASVYTSGTAARWDLVYGASSGGMIRLDTYDRAGAVVASSAFWSCAANGRGARYTLGLTETGGNVAWEMASVAPGATVGYALSGTVTGRTVGAVQRLVFGPKNNAGAVVVGHVTVETAVDSVFALGFQLNAYLGETAGDRMVRLAAENGETLLITGRISDTARMGYQRVATFLDLVKECADSDGGILYEPTDTLGIAYRTRRSLERRNPTVALSYPGHQMMDLQPMEDDRSARNLVTVSRKDGGSGTAELTSGALSTAAPPDGIGKYDSSTTLSLASDIDAVRQAWWRLHLGTVDEARYPTLRVNLASRWMWEDQVMVRDVLDMDVGDRLDVTGPPVWVPPDDITQVAIGYKEVLGQYVHDVTWNLTPASPYRVAVYDDGVSRYSSDGSTLAAGVDAAATSWTVATPTGPVWSHVDGDFDLMVGGERVTVTAVTGASSPQAFTVVRSVNDVVKAHAAGATVELAEPYWYGL